MTRTPLQDLIRLATVPACHGKVQAPGTTAGIPCSYQAGG